MTAPPESLETLMQCKHYARLKTSENGIWTHLDMAMERHCIRCGEPMVFVSVRDHAAMRAVVEAFSAIDLNELHLDDCASGLGGPCDCRVESLRAALSAAKDGV